MADFDYLILGGGMTGAAAAGAIRAADPRGTIGMISTEADPPYNRPPLTKKLWQGKPESSIWRALPEEGFTLLLDCRVDAIHPQQKQVVDQHGRAYGYGKLLLATGGTPKRLPEAPGGPDVPGDILYYRTFADYQTLRGWTGKSARFGVIGSGFIGSEVAQALASLGERVLLTFRSPSLGAGMYPADLSRYVTTYYREKGVDVRAGAKIEEITHHGDGFLLRFADGQQAEVDHLVAGLGIEPNTALAKDAGIALLGPEEGGGIAVDEFCRTSQPDIYAAGDVAGFPSQALGRVTRVEHADNADTMGAAAGRNMAGQPEPYHHLPFFYSDMFDLGYEAVGEIKADMDIFADWQQPMRKGVLYYRKDGAVRGVLLWNVWDQVDAARALIQSGKTYSDEDLRGRITG